MLPGPFGTTRDPTMHASGTLRDHTGPGGGEEEEEKQEQDFSVPPALATAESRPRAHTASRRNHVTDTEHDFPVRGKDERQNHPPSPQYAFDNYLGGLIVGRVPFYNGHLD